MLKSVLSVCLHQSVSTSFLPWGESICHDGGAAAAAVVVVLMLFGAHS